MNIIYKIDLYDKLLTEKAMLPKLQYLKFCYNNYNSCNVYFKLYFNKKLFSIY